MNELLGAIIAIVIIISFVTAYRYRPQLHTLFTNSETKVLNDLIQAEQKVLEEFKKGKEDTLNEYDRLKTRVEALVGLGNKIPGVVVTKPIVVPVEAKLPVEPPQVDLLKIYAPDIIIPAEQPIIEEPVIVPPIVG